MSAVNPSTLIILDGGCGLELKKRKAEGHDVAYNTELFSTAAVLETPQGVIDMHRDYVLAGANVITTASYATTRFILDKVDRAEDVKKIAALTVELARKGIEEARRASQDAEEENNVLVAASVGPLTESYRADLVPDDETLREQYSELISALEDADLYLCETISSIREAAVSVPMCVRTGKPVWASFTLEPVSSGASASTSDNGEVINRDKSGTSIIGVRLADGTAVRDALKAVISHGVEAVLFNCVAPELIDLALPLAREVINEECQSNEDKPSVLLGAYGNFWRVCERTEWSMDQQESEPGRGDQGSSGMIIRSDLTAEPYANMTASWHKQFGANIIGGCCGIGPEHIKCISERLRGTLESHL